MGGSMTYRLLPLEEWDRLKPLMDKYDQPMPNPVVASVAVAEKDGEIVAALFFQLVMHMEPLIIEDPRASFRNLKAVIDEGLNGKKGLVYYSFSDSEKVNRMAEIAEMEKTPYTAVWKHEVT